MTEMDMFEEDLVYHEPRIAIVEQLDLFGNPSKFAVQVDGVIVTTWYESKEAAQADFNWQRHGYHWR